MEKEREKSASIAFVVASDQYSIINAAMVAKSENLLSDPGFSLDQIFVVNSQLLAELNLKSYQKLYVIGFTKENVGEKVLTGFLLENYKNLHFWYCENFVNYGFKTVMRDIMSQNSYIGYSPESYISKRNLKMADYIYLLNTYSTLKKRKGYKTELAETFKRSLYAARIYDRLFSDKNEYKPITRKILQKLFKVSLGYESLSVNSMVKAYFEINHNNRQVSGLQLNHSKIGKVEVIRPKNDLVDRKEFFKNLGQVSAIAVTALDKDPDGNIFEVCLNQKTATNINWSEIPYIKRINGCRFLAKKEFVLEK